MSEEVVTRRLDGQRVVVVGGSKGLGRAIVATFHEQGAQTLAVARQAAPLARLADDIPGVRTLSLDATEEGAPEKVFAALTPSILIVSAGAIPHVAPLGEQSWEQFSTNWNADVKLSLLFTQAALNTPLPAGATIILIGSGAAMGSSPLSGGYAGAKRTQMFISAYAQIESTRQNLGLRFITLVPQGIMPETDLGRTAIKAYASTLDITPEQFIQRMGAAPTTRDIATGIAAFASNPGSHEGTAFLVSRDEVKALS